MPDQNDNKTQPAFGRFATLTARWMGQAVTFTIAAMCTRSPGPCSGPISEELSPGAGAPTGPDLDRGARPG
jgi:hypothetical protein